MKSARLSPGQDPEEFLYELDTRRERLNACDPHPPSSSAGVRAHPHIPLREARLRDRRHSPHNAHYPCDQPCPFELDDGSFGDQGCHARGRRQPQRHDLQLLRTRKPFREHVSPPRQVRAAATTTKATERTTGPAADGVNKAGSVETLRQPPSNGGRLRSYHNITNPSDADYHAIKGANGNAHVAAAQHTHMQGICSARDIPDPKEDSERPFISFSATEVTSSAAT